MRKESITLSMELAKTQCYEFECFEDNYSLTISPQGCRINTRKLIPEEHSLYRALEHSIRQHKLNLSLSKTSECSLKLPKAKLEFGRKSFAFQGALVYNTLPRHLRNFNSRFLFKSNLKEFFQ